MILNTNTQALLANNALWHRNNDLQKFSTNLSLGTKVNKTGDDPTGMAVSNKMKMQIKGLEMADRNVNDAVSLIQTAEGSIGEMQNIVQRMRELSVQAANDTLTEEDRRLIQEEINQLAEEINGISRRAEFNKKHLLNGTYEEYTFHIGGNHTDNLTVNFPRIDSEALGVNGLNYTTVEGAENAITRCDEAIERINQYRANLGANQNRFEKISNSLVISEENAHSALSRVMDTDMAFEMAEYTKNNVLVQAGISMLSQANQRPNQLLSLLQ